MLVMCQGKGGTHTLLMEMETVAACWKAVWQYPFLPCNTIPGNLLLKKKKKRPVYYIVFILAYLVVGWGKKRKIK